MLTFAIEENLEKYEQSYTLKQSLMNIEEYVIRSNISFQIVKAQMELFRGKCIQEKIEWQTVVIKQRILIELAAINPRAPADLIKTTFRMM